MPLIFDDMQCQAMRALYEQCGSAAKVGKVFHCSKSTAESAIRRAGGVIGRPLPVVNIMHDWNANVPLDRLCRVYRIGPARLIRKIDGWRESGWGFRKRLITSEETTAGMVRQSGEWCP